MKLNHPVRVRIEAMAGFNCGYVYLCGMLCNDERLHQHYKNPHGDDRLADGWDGKCGVTGCESVAVDRPTYVTIRAMELSKRFCAHHALREAEAECMYAAGL
jgi:hypothetical protein